MLWGKINNINMSDCLGKKERTQNTKYNIKYILKYVYVGKTTGRIQTKTLIWSLGGGTLSEYNFYIFLTSNFLHQACITFIIRKMILKTNHYRAWIKYSYEWKRAMLSLHLLRTETSSTPCTECHRPQMCLLHRCTLKHRQKAIQPNPSIRTGWAAPPKRVQSTMIKSGIQLPFF